MKTVKIRQVLHKKKPAIMVNSSQFFCSNYSDYFQVNLTNACSWLQLFMGFDNIFRGHTAKVFIQCDSYPCEIEKLSHPVQQRMLFNHISSLKHGTRKHQYPIAFISSFHICRYLIIWLHLYQTILVNPAYVEKPTQKLRR